MRREFTFIKLKDGFITMVRGMDAYRWWIEMGCVQSRIFPGIKYIYDSEELGESRTYNECIWQVQVTWKYSEQLWIIPES